MRAIEQDEVDAILIAPESFANRDFVESVLEPVVETSGLFVIDEAHCISMWGHDFRPDFRRIHEVVKRLGQNTPVLAATATATEAVITDIAVQIGDMAVQRGSLVRESIALDVVRLPSRSARMDWLISHIPQLPGAGIVYALTRHDVQTVAGLAAEGGHCGICLPRPRDTPRLCQLERLPDPPRGPAAGERGQGYWLRPRLSAWASTSRTWVS